jgi:DNA-binding transcriptional regulator YiaG
MEITTEHSASNYGKPVILSDGGEVLDYAEGVKAVRSTLGLSTAEFASKMGTSKRTVEGWEQGRLPSNTALLLMATFLPN